MKIKISCNWDSNINITNRFINTYFNKYVENLLNYEITFNDDYDWHLVFNYSHEKTDFSKTICFIQEPSWSNHIKLDYISKCKYVFFHNKQLLPLNNIIEYPSLMFPHIQDNIYELSNKINEKTKKISFISSNLRGNGNYNFRTTLFEELLKTDLDIDFYGYGWTNINDIRYKGVLDNKKNGLLDYEFSIAIENSCEKNYTSEKFFDCLICNTIPIYYGNPNINEIYDIDSFINLDNTNVENAIFKINEIYKKNNYGEYSKKAKEKYLIKYNILNILKKYHEI